uniref:Uncharacterized protein n=1 Tax=Lepeophtheirus salmonis TaxID=72036 RepID=A0A0K2TVH9_LEPSM
MLGFPDFPKGHLLLSNPCYEPFCQAPSKKAYKIISS